MEKLNHVRCARAFVGLNLVGVLWLFVFVFMFFVYYFITGGFIAFFLLFWIFLLANEHCLFFFRGWGGVDQFLSSNDVYELFLHLSFSAGRRRGGGLYFFLRSFLSFISLLLVLTTILLMVINLVFFFE